MGDKAYYSTTCKIRSKNEIWSIMSQMIQTTLTLHKNIKSSDHILVETIRFHLLDISWNNPSKRICHHSFIYTNSSTFTIIITLQINYFQSNIKSRFFYFFKEKIIRILSPYETMNMLHTYMWVRV